MGVLLEEVINGTSLDILGCETNRFSSSALSGNEEFQEGSPFSHCFSARCGGRETALHRNCVRWTLRKARETVTVMEKFPCVC